MGKAEFDDDFPVLGQLHPLDEADQQFPALPGGFDEPMHQLPGPVLTGDGAFFLKRRLLTNGDKCDIISELPYGKPRESSD